MNTTLVHIDVAQKSRGSGVVRAIGCSLSSEIWGYSLTDSKKLTPELIELAILKKDPVAVRAVIKALTPIIHATVATVLIRRQSAAAGRVVRQEIEDMTQDVFEVLLSDGGKRMLSWDPAQGAASTYFGIITKRRVYNVLDSRKQSPWTEAPTTMDVLEDGFDFDEHLEFRIHSREVLRNVGKRLKQNLSKRDMRLFELLYVTEADDQHICKQLNIGRDALYQARSRLRKRARELTSDFNEGYFPLSDGALAGRNR